VKRLLIGVVRGYQVVSAPVYAAMGGAVSGCRFTPTCSRYAIEALEQHGSVQGSWLTLKRVCRCHPWGGFGYDPVPQHGQHSKSDQGEAGIKK
jgi:uncharacterized protein